VLNQDFKEFIQSLNDNRVRYLVVGGYAVALHGHPRYTVAKHNIASIRVLEKCGFTICGEEEGFPALAARRSRNFILKLSPNERGEVRDCEAL
jgi:hypothetical protein